MRTIGLLFFLCVLVASTFAVRQTESTSRTSPQGEMQAPDQVAVSFYKWYLHEINAGHMPSVQQAPQTKEYISSTLLEELKPKKGAEPRDEDYFLKAQDTEEDWETHITASTPKIEGDIAHTVVTLGASPESKHQLVVSLVNDHGTWKIQLVKAAPSVPARKG